MQFQRVAEPSPLMGPLMGEGFGGGGHGNCRRQFPNWRGRVDQTDACDGSVAVEFAVTVTALLLLFLGIFEFGRYFYYLSSLQQAVEAAARCASIGSPACESGGAVTAAAVQSYAASQIPGTSVPSSVFALTTPAPSCGQQVTGSFAFTSVAPQLFPFSLAIGASSCYPVTPN